ncbi:hypothetical protein TIFTF001_038845 [Ficus carica]|uniref:Uncharacterized protein n=1 Tax=Ficus carica TaxID=3494 RepID=A0AA88JDC3_FICCA|nr:hypothetical protein TIFTF001_038839 [Ficus carica]GMN69799.1 hypothetical protein TIFTF001_038845 [Ficus carica]
MVVRWIEKSSQAVGGSGGDGDPSSRCCGCRRAREVVDGVDRRRVVDLGGAGIG